MKVFSDSYFPEFQLQREVASFCEKALTSGAKKREQLETNEEWHELKKKYMGIVKSAFPERLFHRKKAAIQTRVVSRYHLDGLRIENVVFCSLDGMEVNGTIYLPEKPGIYPAVLCPSGHGSKSGGGGQGSLQMIARNGYAVLFFDAPGFGERRFGNDHFMNGAVGYLSGIWSMTFFVADVLYAMDYLETRPDIQKEHGFAVTGVSGGGLTSIFSAILDKRIQFCAPACCLTEHGSLHLKDRYTSCPEQFGPGFIAAGMDYIDYICLISPKPCLMMAGRYDSLYDAEINKKIYNKAAKIYRHEGHERKLELFIDEDAGHAYTLRMAYEVVRRLNRLFKGTEGTIQVLNEKEVIKVEEIMLECGSAYKVNMFTINRDEVKRLECRRRKSGWEQDKQKIYDGVQKCLDLQVRDTGIPKVSFETSEKVFTHLVSKTIMVLSDSVRVPGLLLKRPEYPLKQPALLFIDERGKWEGIRQGGFLTQTAGFLEEKPHRDEPLVWSIEVTGMGELTPEPVSYDLAGWNDIDRILSYLSIAANKPVMGFAIRDALCALDYLASMREVDEGRILVGGRGVGALVALFTAFLYKKAQKVICVDGLSRYGNLAMRQSYLWKQSILLPGILGYCDLPDIVRCLTETGVFIINPLDGEKRPVPSKTALRLYEGAGKNVQVLFPCKGETSEELFIRTVKDERI